MKSEIRLEIIGVVYNQGVVNTYSLVMREADGNKRFSVVIGEPEAQAIALKMNNKFLPRPLTHDLIKNILHTLKAGLKKIVIYDLVNDIFHSELYIENSEKRIFIVDARTSDAMALAVRAECPVYIKSEILDIVGMETEQPDEVRRKKLYTFDNLDNMPEKEMRLIGKEELGKFLERAIKEERYELAVKLRNALEIQNNNQ